MKNAIMVITPYRKYGTWCFSDENTGLVDEPFVAGIPQIIDLMVKDIPTAESGFKMTFSGEFFPGHTHVLNHTRGEGSGNWYVLAGDGMEAMEGWLCPALFKYFDEAPKMLYAKAEAL